MPNRLKANTTNRDYAPQEYIKVREGDTDSDENYLSVGDAHVQYIETDAAGKFVACYRIGATALGLVCDKTTDIFTHSDLSPLPIAAMPPGARDAVVKEAVEAFPSSRSCRLLRALSFSLPEETELIPDELLEQCLANISPDKANGVDEDKIAVRERRLG